MTFLTHESPISHSCEQESGNQRVLLSSATQHKNGRAPFFL